MGYTQLFRLDDISWDMNYENFSRIRDLFLKYDIRPLIGIIPHNEDAKLKKQAGDRGISQDRFWAEMLDLQQNHGWAVALHGYDHVYVTSDSGIFKINDRSEFAGLPYEQQEEKIRLGKAILESHGLCIDAFMAPAHSLDWNTVEALKKNNITVITDGRCAYPYWKNGVLFMPQVWSKPHRGVCGIFTACFHINSWADYRFQKLERFIQKHKECCGTFPEAVRCAAEGRPPFWRPVNAISRVGIFLGRKVLIIGSKIKYGLIRRRSL